MSIRPKSIATLSIVVFLPLQVCLVEGKTIHVNNSCGDDAWSGEESTCTIPTGPKKTIQAAIDSAIEEDVILVMPGEYVVTCPVTFLGKNIEVRSQDGPEETVIRMSNSPSDPGRASVVVFESGETYSSVLEGFSLTGGRGTLVEQYGSPGTCVGAGGGILCISSSPQILSCVISGNQAELVGGGMACWGASLLVADCTFRQNSVYHSTGQAGGVFLFGDSCAPQFVNCEFCQNFAPYAGGGIQVSLDSSPVFDSCLIAGNTTQGSIGGLLCSFSSLTQVQNCVIVDNSAALRCGGIGCGHDATAVLTNCTVTNNSAGVHSGGIYSYDKSSVTVTNCIVWQNTAPLGPEVGLSVPPASMTVSFSDIKGGVATAYVASGCTLDWQVGNIDADPCFADVYTGDYHLKSRGGRYDPTTQAWIYMVDEVTSPCIDAGNPQSPIAFESFPNGGFINMGAYGGTAEASKSFFNQGPCPTVIAGDINGDCRVDLKDLSILALHWMESYLPAFCYGEDIYCFCLPGSCCETIACDFDGNCQVDLEDLTILVLHWMEAHFVLPELCYTSHGESGYIGCHWEEP